jgi:hypothetical protein
MGDSNSCPSPGAAFLELKEILTQIEGQVRRRLVDDGQRWLAISTDKGKSCLLMLYAPVR